MKLTEALREMCTDLFVRAKSGRNPTSGNHKVTATERQFIADAFNGPFADQCAECIKTFPLLFDETQENLERFRAFFAYVRKYETMEMFMEDRVEAIITGVCNYWGAAERFEPELRSILELWEWDEAGDACIGAGIYFASLTYKTKSVERFNFLKGVVLRRYDETDSLGRTCLVENLISSVIGPIASHTELRKVLCSKHAIAEFTL